jgi:hypothetical protein
VLTRTRSSNSSSRSSPALHLQPAAPSRRSSTPPASKTSTPPRRSPSPASRRLSTGSSDPILNRKEELRLLKPVTGHLHQNFKVGNQVTLVSLLTHLRIYAHLCQIVQYPVQGVDLPHLSVDWT